MRAEDDTLTNIYYASITLISNQPVNDNMITSVKYVNDNFALKSSLNELLTNNVYTSADLINDSPKTTDFDRFYYNELYGIFEKNEKPITNLASLILSGVVFKCQITDYLTKSECDEKYIKKNSLLEITSPSSNIAKFYSSVDANVITSISFGYNDVYNTDFEYKSSKSSNSGNLDIYVDGYKFQSFQMFGSARNTLLYSNLKVNGTITSNGSTTITHYSPIESSVNTITDFVIGAPVYMTGKVYHREDSKWVPSTEADTTDCICSVKTTGTWKEYVGICVRIDEANNCITFATHGDYMVKVEDSSCYSIGGIYL